MFSRRGKALWTAIFAVVFGLGCGAADYQVFFGDIHTHTSYSDDARALQMERYGRLIAPGEALDNALMAGDGLPLDFVTITDHAESFNPVNGLWANYIKFVQEFEAEHGGECVAFVGFEYTNSTDTPGHGHRCVIFKSLDAADLPPQPVGYNVDTCSSADSLWKELEGYTDYLTIPHHPAKGASQHITETWLHSTDWNYTHESQALVEIYSVHGNSERGVNARGEIVEEPVYNFRANASVEAALGHFITTRNPRYKLGIVASTDLHLSHPGMVTESTDWVVRDEGPYTGGLVGVMATSKTRENIFNALKSKHTYATSGPRIVLTFSATHGGGEAIMGDTLNYASGQPVAMTVTAKGGTEGIAKIEIYRNGALVRTEPYSGLTTKDTATLQYTDAAPPEWGYYRVKAYQNDTLRVNDDFYTNEDNKDTTLEMAPERAWSSPIFIENPAKTAVVFSVPEVRVPAGENATFQVRLSRQPEQAVTTVNVRNVAGDESIEVVSGGTLNFNAAEWNQWQTVTLFAPDLGETYNVSATIQGSSDGALGASLTADKIAKNEDGTDPGTVADFSGAAMSPTSVKLTWTAPGSDGNSGQAESYDIRYSLEPITRINWPTRDKCVGAPYPGQAGTTEYFMVKGLIPGTKYYLVMKTSDKSGNTSELSNSVEITMPAMTVTLSDLPAAITSDTETNIRVGGDGVTAYKYSLDNGTFSAETLVAQRLALTGLNDGVHTILVIGKDYAGTWQDTSAGTSAQWEVNTSSPFVSVFSPLDNAANASVVGPFTMLFNEAVTLGAGNIVFYNAADDSVFESFDVQGGKVTVNGALATLQPSTSLVVQTRYYVLADAGTLLGPSGNPWPGIADKTVWNFMTASPVCVGSYFTLRAIALDPTAAFPKKPKVYASYLDPVGQSAKTKNLKVVYDKAAPSSVVCQWTTKQALFDKKKKAKTETVAQFLAKYPIAPLSAQGKADAADVTGAKKTFSTADIVLRPPTIVRVLDANGQVIQSAAAGQTIVVEGTFFGEKAPSVYLEYKTDKGEIKQKRLTVQKPYAYPNINNKAGASCSKLDSPAGESRVTVTLPSKFSKDWDTVSAEHNLVIDNGVGLATTPFSTKS